MMHLNEHFIYLLACYKFLISIPMLVWCMLVIGLNDEMKNQHAQVKKLDFVHFMETRPLLLMLISWGILVFVYVQLLMMLRMVYWCTPVGITLQRSISYTLASFGRHYPPTTQILAYVKPSIQNLNTYVGGANATNGGS